MRKIQDHYFRLAKKEGFLARSVYKLEELDRKYRIVSPGGRVLDLGSSPGSWSQFARKRVGKTGLIVAVDAQPMAWKGPENVKFLQRDIFQLQEGELRSFSDAFDVVLSDLAPSTTGAKETDRARSVELAESAFELARKFLRPGGNFVVKVFQGEDFPSFLRRVKSTFEFCKASKPSASRPESAEIYIVGLRKH